MKKTILSGTMFGIIVMGLLLMGCESTPYYSSPEYLNELQASRRTEIIENEQTERTEIRESERTAQKEAEAERALNMRLMQQEQNAHNETMFRLYSLALIGSGYSSMIWIVAGGVVGGIAGYAVRDRVDGSKPKHKGGRLGRKLKKALIVIAEGLAGQQDYGL